MLQRSATLIKTTNKPPGCCLRLASVFLLCNKTDDNEGKLENDVTLLSLVSDDDDDDAHFNECIRNFLASPCSAQNKGDDSFN
jgi:hypothetical protein